MDGWDDRLHRLRTRIDGKPHAEAALKNLLEQRRALETQVWELNYARLSEQEDVDRLSDQSFRTRLVRFLRRDKVDEEKEKRELEVAILQHDRAQQELKELDRVIAEKQDALNRIADAEADYERLLQRKADAIEGSAAEEIKLLRNRIADRESHMQNIAEAILAGRKVGMIVIETRDALNAAIDICNPFIRRRRFLSERVRILNKAQEQLGEFIFRVRRFRSELVDVLSVDEKSLQIGDLDLYENRFRNLRGRRDRVLEIDRIIRGILSGLDERHHRLEEEVKEIQEQVRTIILETKV